MGRDDGLGDAERIDASPDRLDGLGDRVFLEDGKLGGTHFELKARRAQAAHVPRGIAVVDERTEFATLISIETRHDQFARLHYLDIGKGDALVIEHLFQIACELVRDRVQGVDRIHLHDEVDAALEIEAELDLLLRWVESPAASRHDGEDEHGLPTQVLLHGLSTPNAAFVLGALGGEATRLQERFDGSSTSWVTADFAT